MNTITGKKRAEIIEELSNLETAARFLKEAVELNEVVQIDENFRQAFVEVRHGVTHLINRLTPAGSEVVHFDIPHDWLANIVCSGVESGIAYWCKSANFSDVPVEGVTGVMTRYHQPLTDVGSIDFVAHDGDHGRLDRAALLEGVKLLVEKYPNQAGAVLNPESDQQDATTGDALIQLAIFKELRFC